MGDPNEKIDGNGGTSELHVTEISIRYTRPSGKPCQRQSCCRSGIPDVGADTLPLPRLFFFNLLLRQTPMAVVPVPFVPAARAPPCFLSP